MFVLLFIVLWGIIGAASIIFWWTKDYDFTTDELGILFMGAAAGPMSFFIGWGAFYVRNPKTLFKRRK